MQGAYKIPIDLENLGRSSVTIIIFLSVAMFETDLMVQEFQYIATIFFYGLRTVPRSAMDQSDFKML